MKKLQRMFGRKSVSNRDDEGGSTTESPRPSSARRRSTERRSTERPTHLQSQRPTEEFRTQAASSSSPFASNYKRVVDNNIHISKTDRVPAGNLFYIRSTWHTASSLYHDLSKNVAVRQLIDNTGLCALFKRTMPNSDRTVVEACCKRWWDTTHTFHLPTCELGFTPLDFTMLTGISVAGGKLPVPQLSEEWLLIQQQGTLAEYFPYFDGEVTNGAIKGGELSQYLSTGNIVQLLGPVAVARIFLFYVLSYVFFPNGNNTCLLYWFNYVLDIEDIGSYDWGSAILARIYSGLDIACRRKVKSLNFFWQPIEFFFYEYMATVCPVLIDEVPDRWPRIHRWSWDTLESAKNRVRFNLDVADQQMEMRSMHSIIWQPYTNDIAMQFPMQQASLHISRHRYLLLDPQTGGNWYLGERCYRQIYGRIAIPNDPPEQMNKIPRSIFDQYHPNGWELCTWFLAEATKEVYEEYWAYVSSGPSLPPIGRGVNIDVVGYAALIGNEVEMPCTPHELQGRVYNTQSGSSSSQPSFPDWSYTISTATGEIIQMPLPRNAPPIEAPPAASQSRADWRNLYIDAMNCANQLRSQLFVHTEEMAQQLREKDQQLKEKDAEIAQLKDFYQSFFQWTGISDN